MSRWIDVTRPMDERLVCWPGRVPPRCTWKKRIDRGDHCNASEWHLSAHSGTHVDAPLHFCTRGRAIDEIPSDVFVGDCTVVDLSAHADPCLNDTLADRYVGTQRLLLRTRHSEPSQGSDYPPHGALLTAGAVARLLTGGLLLVGTDRLSVDDSDGADFAMHRSLLGAGCVILEGLMLADVEPGRYVLHAVPLPLTGAEASPVRALLRPPDPA